MSNRTDYLQTLTISNYKFTVTPKHIEITPNNFENKVYDGLSYVYDIVENNFYEKLDLISGDGITIEAEIIYLKEVKIVTITNDVVITETEIEEQVVSEAKDAGSYKIRVKNYEFTSGIETNYVVDKTNEVSFEISKRDVKILLDKALDSKIYDGYRYEYTYTVDNIVAGEEIDAEIAYLGQSYNETEILYVDTYDVYVKQIINNVYLKNYTVDITDTHIFTVTQKPVTIRPIDMPDLIYGEAITYNPNSYVFVSGELTLIDDSTAISINVGYFKNTKGSAIDKVLKHLNINKEETIGAGDSFDDISMFKSVGLSICMGNGSDEAKKEADVICESIGEHGLGKTLIDLIN